MSFRNLFIIEHPLIAHKLTVIRDKNCSSENFKRELNDITTLMAYRVLDGLPITDKVIETPIEKMTGKSLAGKPPIIVPILRAGLGMSEAMHKLIPQAVIGHIGLYRDHETKLPHEYLVKLPDDITNRPVIIVDPMLATGHSAVYAVEILVKRGVKIKDIRFMSLVSAPEGVECFQKTFPNISIYTASLDRQLNENAYICPGLGDAGDRIFGTAD